MAHLDRFVLFERIEHFRRDVGANRRDRIGRLRQAGRREQTLDHALERGVLVAVRLDEHVARHHGDQLAIAQQISRHAEADVAEPLAEHQQAV